MLTAFISGTKEEKPSTDMLAKKTVCKLTSGVESAWNKKFERSGMKVEPVVAY